uniref:Apple domain-containing protein n=1 Tax=Plectus sambesii TaxID=2011161 RepID=A0A914WA88_9BILA
MINTFVNGISSATNVVAWVAASRNLSYASPLQGWTWRTRLPSGENATFPFITSNLPWMPGEPNNQYGNEAGGMLGHNYGFGDVPKDFPSTKFGVQKMAVICQFAPPQWSFSKRGHGRFAVSAYQIVQSTVIELACVVQCYQTLFCISLAFNPTTNDCQIYGVSPEDPRFSGSVTADSSYDWYIRDGMEY